MKQFLLFALFLFAGMGYAHAQVKSPDDFLGYELGSKFTLHQKIVDYFKYLASCNENIRLIGYGKTYEGRELLVAVVSSKKNLENLEIIRKNNLDLSKAKKTSFDLQKQPAILWLSYNVHGNEASPAETAMKMLYALSEAKDPKIKKWLNNTVVIIDPCLNPDGRERYIHYFDSVSGEVPNLDPEAPEHNEPWPTGRGNHYYFDLNRDWAWQTQIETQQRVALYHQWMPEVHVDFHEQGYDEPYYFVPAAEPVHQDITPWQRAFQAIVGKNNAKYFDERGWTYDKKERFDLLYPSYGDTYPLYNGAVGMTYEQGGINAGLAIASSYRDTLTLKDRIDHNFAAGMVTLETVSDHAARLLQEFEIYFKQSVSSPPGKYQTYIIKADNLPRLKKLADLLTKNHIEFTFGANKTLSGYDFETQKTGDFKIERNDMIVNLHQPQAVLANVLFEPQTLVRDSNTYDITAWALPYAYGLHAYGSNVSIKGGYTFIKDIKENKPARKMQVSYVRALSWNPEEKIAVVSGAEVTSESIGEIWHFFEQELRYPVSLIDIRALDSLDINKTNVLILPDGVYPKNINEKLGDWINMGGKLILMEDAVADMEGRPPFDIKKKDFPVDYGHFGDAIPGAIYKVSLDKVSPLAFGLGDYYYTLKIDDKIYEPLTNGRNVGVLKPNAFVAGVAGKNVKLKLDNGLLFGIQPKGKGCIIYLCGDVLFRSFWENGKQMFANAVFLVN